MRKRKICVVTGTRAEYGLAKWVWGILNWAIINGEEKFGVTVHYVDEGIDTGDIILQKFASIGKQERYGEVLCKAHHLCADTLYEALVLLSEGRAERIPQKSIHPVGFYCSGRLWRKGYR